MRIGFILSSFFINSPCLFIAYTDSAYRVESDGFVESNHLNSDDSYGIAFVPRKKSTFRSPDRTNYDGSAYFVVTDGNVGGYNIFHGITNSYGRIPSPDLSSYGGNAYHVESGGNVDYDGWGVTYSYGK